MELQQQNAVRLAKLKEFKRNKIIEADLILKEKNTQKKNALQLYDSLVRNQAISNNKAKEITSQALNKLMKTDPLKILENENLMYSMRELNENFHLGLTLDLPAKEPTNELALEADKQDLE